MNGSVSRLPEDAILHSRQFRFLGPATSFEHGGTVYDFMGWHTSHSESLDPSEGHYHISGNQMDADTGDLYTTHDPTYWADLLHRSHAHEVWKPRASGGSGGSVNAPGASWDSGLHMNEKVMRGGGYVLGDSYPVHRAAERSLVRYSPIRPSTGGGGEPVEPEEYADLLSTTTTHPHLPKGTPLYVNSGNMQALLSGPGSRTEYRNLNWSPTSTDRSQRFWKIREGRRAIR